MLQLSIIAHRDQRLRDNEKRERERERERENGYAKHGTCRREDAS